MKRPLLFLFCIILLSSVLSLPVFAHPGRTDQYGGHWDHSTGEYHYHGEPDSSTSGGGSSGSTTDRDWGDSDHSGGSGSSSSSSNAGEIVGIIIACVVFGPFLLICIFVPIFEKVKELFAKKENPPPTIQKEVPPPEPPLQKEEPPRKAAAPSTKPNPPTPPSVEPEVFIAPPSSTEGQPRVDVPHDALKKSVSPPHPHVRGSEEYLPPFPPPAKSETRTPKPRTIPLPPPQPPTVRKPLEQYPDILDVNFDYLTQSRAEAFAASIDSPRGKRAVAAHFIFDNLHVDESTKPFRTTCSVISVKSYHSYETSLSSCSCPDHQKRRIVCKHMIALALKVGAISVDEESINSKYD
ncbi:MAG: YHYH domain-containing protein [Clostridia bacterium]|nr:YHYH domain-containing protein [Clostridia bacterium]